LWTGLFYGLPELPELLFYGLAELVIGRPCTLFYGLKELKYGNNIRRAHSRRPTTEGVTRLATRRVTMREAAEALGVSKEAIRKRVIRGTLRSEVGGDGRRHVYIDAGGDAGGDEAPTGELGASGAHQALVSEMRGRS
jgi:hypothetical protein